MNENEISLKIKELGQPVKWFQCIDFGNGIKTKVESAYRESVDYPQEQWECVRKYLPENLYGKKILDVGCNAGYFCIEAKKRGALKVVGIDHSEEYLAQARFAAEVLKLDIEYRKLEVSELSQLGEKFDIVLCLGLIYHCKDIVSAVEAISSVCLDQIIVETLMMHLNGRFERFIFNRLLGLNQKPLFQYVYVPDEKEKKRELGRDDNWIAPNELALKRLFKTVGFKNCSRIKLLGQRGYISCYK